ncbi:MAG: CoB--CoM heterodisulfide reductase iron-sulfur subunit A family protein, partial [Candidatus Thorarchaeota archaeon]
LFQETCQEAGLNKYLFEMVNIRDQCSWVHMTEKELATEKAIDLIKMGVAKSRLLKSQEETILKITQTAMVIGGGISGMTAALNIANQGFKVYLIEKEQYLGGNLRYLNMLYPTQEDASILLNETIDKVTHNKNIQTFLNSCLKDLYGYLGNYNASVIDSDNKVHELKIGTIIVATGGKELKPNEFFKYTYTNHNVITQLQLEQKLKDEDQSWLDNLNHITTLLCVNARQKNGITYCSNICCETAIKNINILKEIKQDLKLIVLYRDLQMAKKEFERYYRERRKDAIFLRYDLNNPPIIREINGGREKFEIRVFDTNLQENINFNTDLIVLSTPMVPADNLDELARMLKVPLDKNGFFLEAHVKLRPLDFATDGIFLCGCAHWPKNIQDSISQANGAAGRACRFLSSEEITTSGLIAEVDQEICIGCGTCEETCSYNAIEIINVVKEFEEVSLPIKKSTVNSGLCKGCGTCAVNCPVGAISIKHYDFEQINAMIKTLAM